MKNLAEMAYWAIVRKDLKAFLRHAFLKTVYPGEQFLDNWHLDALVYNLQRALSGELRRQIINMPPRALKSYIVSVAFAAFAIGHDPTIKLMCVSYSDELAKLFARDFRRIVESPWYRMLFPAVKWTKLTETDAVTDQGGGRYAISVGGSLTGRGADIILIDDPIKAADAQSEKARRSSSEWFKNTLSSRLNDKKHGVMILVMQRVHVSDLTGELDAAEFHKLSLSAIAEVDEDIAIGPGRVHRRLAGEVLHPAHTDRETLEKLRKQMGATQFAAQYQQRPEMPSGNLFKRAYLQITDQMPSVAPGAKYWVSIDAAQSTSEWADFSALTLGYSVPGPNGPHSYIIETQRGRWDFEELVQVTESYCQRIQKNDRKAVLNFVIENASAGISLILYLRKRGHMVFTQHSMGDKAERAYKILHAFTSGRVTLVRRPGKDQWFDPFLAEVLTFPHGRFDDQVDSLVYGVIFAEDRVRVGFYDT